MQDEIEDAAGKVEDGKNYEYRVQVTDGVDVDGNSFDNVIVTNPSNGKVSSFQVINNNLNTAQYQEAAKQLSKGNSQQAEMAKNIMANMSHMSDVKKSKMSWNNKGKIPVRQLENSEGLPLTVEWIKVDGPDRDRFIASIGDRVLNDGNPIYTEQDMSLAIASFVSNVIKSKAKKEQ